MPGRDEHLRQVRRFEAFLGRINTPDQPYKEWVVIVRFHVCLHYLDAFLATKGYAVVAGHSDRLTKIRLQDETKPIAEDYHRLYKEAKEARYEGAEFTSADLESVERLYSRVRNRVRAILQLSE